MHIMVYQQFVTLLSQLFDLLQTEGLFQLNCKQFKQVSFPGTRAMGPKAYMCLFLIPTHSIWTVGLDV